MDVHGHFLSAARERGSPVEAAGGLAALRLLVRPPSASWPTAKTELNFPWQTSIPAFCSASGMSRRSQGAQQMKPAPRAEERR